MNPPSTAPLAEVPPPLDAQAAPVHGVRRSLARQLGASFLLLALLLSAAWTTVALHLVATLRDGEKFMEENREVRLAQTFLTCLGEISLLSLLPTDAAGKVSGSVDPLIEELLTTAQQTLDRLRAGPPGADPSRQEHQSEENRLYAEIASSLARSRALLVAGDGQRGELRALVSRLNELGTELEEETVEEAFLSSQDLERRSRNLLWLVSIAIVFSLAVLVFLYAFVYRRALRPILRLREGAASLGAGRLHHRVAADAQDEIGELARELNRMAESIERSHLDLEARVRERTQEFIQAAKLAGLGTLAAGVAHEVNTPLASIASAAEGLERRLRARAVPVAEQVESLQTIAHEAYRAHEILARLLAFARREPGVRQPLRPEDVLHEVERSLRHTMENAGVRLNLVLGAALPGVEANGPELQQVLLNLVKNALDASAPGDCVELAAQRHGGELVIEVRDRGHGIPVEDLTRIFDPFFTTKEPGKGTGLGLSLAYRIVEQHGGRLSAENRPGGGACFRVCLPAVRQAVEALA